MKAQDDLHHAAWVTYILTLKTIQMCVGISGSIMIGLCVGVGQGLHTNKAKEANGWIPALHHYHVELTLGWNLYYEETEQHDKFGICIMLNSCASMMKQTTLTLWKGKNTKIVSNSNNVTRHGTKQIWFNILRNMWTPGWVSSPTGRQDLCPINT